MAARKGAGTSAGKSAGKGPGTKGDGAAPRRVAAKAAEAGPAARSKGAGRGAPRAASAGKSDPAAAKAPSESRPGSGPSARPEVGERPARQETDGRAMALTLAPGDLPEPMRAYFAKCEERIGFVPHVLVAYAHEPAKLEAFAAMYNELMLGPSGLSKLEREMIAVAVSSVNRCYYCLTAHGAAVRQLSGDPVLGEVMAMNYRAADLSARHRAMLDFAVALTEAPWTIEEEDRAGLREAGFSERDLWDVAAVASFFNMSNRMASAVDMRPNRAYHAQARGE